MVCVSVFMCLSAGLEQVSGCLSLQTCISVLCGWSCVVCRSSVLVSVWAAPVLWRPATDRPNQLSDG